MIRSLELCMNDIKDWMDSNRLKMNATKTEFIIFGSKKQLHKCTTESLRSMMSWCLHLILLNILVLG